MVLDDLPKEKAIRGLRLVRARLEEEVVKVQVDLRFGLLNWVDKADLHS